MVLCYLSVIKWFRYIIPLLIELVCWFNGERRLREKVKSIRSRRAVSPVIATVIMVAVTITVAVAVAYWMSGIAGQYTKFEKVEIQTGVCTYSATNTYWEITIKLKNSGTKTATLTDVFVNDVEATYSAAAPIGAGNAIEADLDPSNTKQILSGATDTVTVWIGATGATLTAGTTVNIKIHSAGGMDYIKLIELV